MNNETIEVIKRMVADGAISQESAEKYCPQLMWSEDERIRKALITYFTLSDDNADYQCCGVHCRDILAWLEKQGEEKPNLNNWKPTKEQLKALSDFLQYNVVTTPSWKTLNSLFKDLSDL